jgi:KaiC/GvpD/RAD55 family RecA-like ATPase
MTNSIELQAICRILTTEDQFEIDRLCAYDTSYYSILTDQIEFILNHKDKTGKVPDLFTFQAQFEDLTLITVNEPLSYLEEELKKNKQRILFLETYNKIADLGSGDVSEAWEYLSRQCEAASQLDTFRPVDVVKDADLRAERILEYSKQTRIPTGFKEIDDVMYGGLSTVEEFLVIVARTNAGKSWVCTKMLESAHKNRFPVLYYSPEMQSSFIGIRFDTWRGHFKNSELYKGNYSDEYKEYIKNLVKDEIGALVVEDSDMSEGRTTVHGLEQLVKRYGIKLLIIDGLSYIASNSRYGNESLKYKDICNDLFRLSKRYGCAVVTAVQANRETRDNRDENGESFPNVYNISESDHPARIATQVFSMRQLHEQHVLEIRLEKSRNARNERPTFAYSIDFNSGSMEYISDRSAATGSTQDEFRTPIVSAQITTHLESEQNVVDDDEDYSDLEF